MEVYCALGTQIKVRVSLPSKGLGTSAARAKGPRTAKKKREGAKSWPAGCIYMWGEGGGGTSRGDVRTQGSAEEEV
jgi:hypothetical protein